MFFCKIVEEEKLEDETEYFNIASFSSMSKPRIKTGKFFFHIDTVLSETKLQLKGCGGFSFS